MGWKGGGCCVCGFVEVDARSVVLTRARLINETIIKRLGELLSATPIDIIKQFNLK